MRFLILTGFLTLALAQHSEDQTPLRYHSLSNIDEIPKLGFGTWNLKGNNVSEAVSYAIQTGYRHIDCAAAYYNQKEVGKGIKDGLKKAGLSRGDIWVTSKLWNDAHTPGKVAGALEMTLLDLDLEWLDLYLMHWPVSSEGGNHIDYLDTWSAMSALEGVRHIGVSNFSPKQLRGILALHESGGSIRHPYAHQMEIHPYLQQASWQAFHREKGIKVTAYSPLGNSNPTYHNSKRMASMHTDSAVPLLLENPLITAIADRRGCTPAQVVLSWGMGNSHQVIPKALRADHIAENFDSLECVLNARDIEDIENKLPTKRFNNPSSGWNVKLFEGLEDSGSDEDSARTELKV